MCLNLVIVFNIIIIIIISFNNKNYGNSSSDHTVKLTAVPKFQVKKSGNLTLNVPIKNI